tara:strand:+ start:73 stop:264 length:192 start_codon:yes stop_codon:yes gene_type:complete
MKRINSSEFITKHDGSHTNEFVKKRHDALVMAGHMSNQKFPYSDWVKMYDMWLEVKDYNWINT